MARIDTGGVRKAIATGQHRLPRSSTGICNTTLMIVSLLYRTARTLLSVHAVVHQGRAVDTRLRDPRSDPDGRAPWGEMGVILQQVVGLCLESGRKAVQVGIRRSSTFSACGQGAMPPPRAVITPGGGHHGEAGCRESTARTRAGLGAAPGRRSCIREQQFGHQAPGLGAPARTVEASSTTSTRGGLSRSPTGARRGCRPG